jgi:heme/copper-type cytochrome/quinol oxidase subunit 4
VRPYDEDPMSRTAQWSRRFALFSVPVTAIAVLVVRSGKVETAPALSAVVAGLALAGLAIALSLAAFLVIWFRGERGALSALIGMVVATAVLAYPAYVVANGWTLPDISDVTTDVADPPLFAAAEAERVRGDNMLAYAGERLALVQLAAYPQIVPLTTDLSVVDTHAMAVQLMRDRGWQILSGDKAPPAASAAVIEAVAPSLVLGLKHDVVIRLRAAGRGARVDMRAASRYGSRDFGGNASLIRSFLADLDAQMH